MADAIKKYEVVKTINLGSKAGVLEPGSEMTSKQATESDIATLLQGGYIIDADAPIPPSQAEGQLAFDRLAGLAQKIGVLKRDGSSYRLGDKSAKGLAAFRKAVSIDDLEAAIVKTVKG